MQERHCWLLGTQLQPLLLVPRQLFRCELAAPRVLIVVAVNLGMAVETHWDCVRDAIIAAIRRGPNVISFDLHAAVAVTDTAPSVACCQERSNLGSVERHSRPSPAFALTN